MLIGSYCRCSMVDYEGHLSSVIFTVGCNMNCPYCHNQGLLREGQRVQWESIMNHLKRRKNQLEAVVVSGGEPTLHKDLPDYLRGIKAMGYKIKLDTNGTNPAMLADIIREGLVNHIAMDIKAGPETYEAISGVPFEAVETSICLLREFGQYEFRTTLYPVLRKDEIQRLCAVYEHDPYWLQQYRPISDEGMSPYSQEEICTLVKDYNVQMRGFGSHFFVNMLEKQL